MKFRTFISVLAVGLLAIGLVACNKSAPQPPAAAQFDELVANARQAIASKDAQGATVALRKLYDMPLTDAQSVVLNQLTAQARPLVAKGSPGAVATPPAR